jgi:hypothetical protein
MMLFLAVSRVLSASTARCETAFRCSANTRSPHLGTSGDDIFSATRTVLVIVHSSSAAAAAILVCPLFAQAVYQYRHSYLW